MYYGVMQSEDIYNMVSYVCGLLDKDTRAEKLILGTIAQETLFGTYQDPTKNAGMGLCQIDKITFEDIKKRTRNSRKELMLKVWDIDIELVEWVDLRYNPLLSVIFCRLFYKLIPEKIEDNLESWATYWKKHYNKIGRAL